MSSQSTSQEVDSQQSTDARYSVGIDLGTTHSVVSFVDNQSDELELVHEIFPIPQLTALGSIEAKSQLPSFLYIANQDELSCEDVALPWDANPTTIVGQLARELGAKTPLRLVSSAKSWLCHLDVDRHAPILPLEAPEEVVQVSPVEATQQYLSHLMKAWDHAHPNEPLAQQDVVLTIPASFDPAARELTAEAAEALGIQQLTLLEEPQAAVYSWIKASGQDWRERVTVGDVILVIDIGGGTTDLSLISAVEEAGSLQLNRVAVGEHILLGGDNMDLALAYRLNAKLAEAGKVLQPWQIMGLTQGCRAAKETLLSDDSIDAIPIVVPSRGSKLLGSTLRTELTRAEVTETLVEGFFPQNSLAERPQQARRGALKKLGLSYAADAGITRHLAAFLHKHRYAIDPEDEPVIAEDSSEDDHHFIQPTAILFNGGTLKSPLLANRLFSIINGWIEHAGGQPARLLDGADLDLAVAKGAAYYGNVRRGQGVRIRGGLASSYYVGIESAMPAIPGVEPPIQLLCVAPFGIEEGTEVDMPSEAFGLIVGEPVQFRFFGSTVRREDEVGTLLEYWEPDQLEELSAIEVTLPVVGERSPGELVPVHLHAYVTAIGTLELEAVSSKSEGRWKVSLDVRNQ